MKVIIFGAGDMGMKYCMKHGSNTEILAFADNDPQKWGKTILGHPIIDPKSIPKENFDKIVIAINDLNSINSISDQLKGMNIPQSKFVSSLLYHLNPIDLGYFTADYGPAIDGKKLKNCRLLGNRYEVLDVLPKNMVCAEVGVAYGDFSQKILETMKPHKLFLVDLYYIKPGDTEFWGRDLFLKSKMDHKEYIEARFHKEISQGIVQVVKGSSHDTLERFDDDFFDYVYLDGGHDYDCVKKDIEILCRKVKNGGIIAFNDYTYFSLTENYEYGVFKAVNELLSEGDHEVLYYCLGVRKFDDIIVKINK